VNDVDGILMNYDSTQQKTRVRVMSHVISHVAVGVVVILKVGLLL
jgi:hypothetical protein